MRKRNIEQVNPLIQIESIELLDSIEYQRNYELDGRIMLIVEKQYDDKDFPLAVYYIEIIALINEEFVQSLGELYREIPFGVFFDKSETRQLVFTKKKIFSKFINGLGKKLKKKIEVEENEGNKYRCYFSSDLKEHNKVLKSQYVEDSLKDGKNVILLKLDSGFVKTLITEDTYENYEERKYDLLTRYFLHDEELREKSDIHRFLKYIYDLVKFNSAHEIVSSDQYFEYLEAIFEFVKKWKKKLVSFYEKHHPNSERSKIDSSIISNPKDIPENVESADDMVKQDRMQEESQYDKPKIDGKYRVKKIAAVGSYEYKLQKLLKVPSPKFKKIGHVFVEPLRNFTAEHKCVRKKWEREKAYIERKRKDYEPLKYFYCSFFDAFIKELEDLQMVSRCKYCENIFSSRKGKEYCTKTDGKIGEEFMDCAKSVRNKKRYKDQKDKKNIISIPKHPKGRKASSK